MSRVASPQATAGYYDIRSVFLMDVQYPETDFFKLLHKLSQIVILFNLKDNPPDKLVCFIKGDQRNDRFMVFVQQFSEPGNLAFRLDRSECDSDPFPPHAECTFHLIYNVWACDNSEKLFPLGNCDDRKITDLNK